jgi:SOS response regulatory protein OraA/RecX
LYLIFSNKTFYSIRQSNQNSYKTKKGLLVDKVKANSIAQEIATVGAGIGRGFSHTQEVIPKKLKEAMVGPEEDEWLKAVEEEYQRRVKYKMFKEVHKSDVQRMQRFLVLPEL